MVDSIHICQAAVFFYREDGEFDVILRCIERPNHSKTFLKLEDCQYISDGRESGCKHYAACFAVTKLSVVFGTSLAVKYQIYLLKVHEERPQIVDEDNLGAAELNLTKPCKNLTAKETKITKKNTIK
jgi:hypothetical protein